MLKLRFAKFKVFLVVFFTFWVNARAAFKFRLRLHSKKASSDQLRIQTTVCKGGHIHIREGLVRQCYVKGGHKRGSLVGKNMSG